MPLIQQPKRESEKLDGIIKSFYVRGSMLVVGGGCRILQLSAASLQSMTDKVEFEKAHYFLISSLEFSKDGKYHHFTLIVHYDLYVNIKLKTLTIKICCIGKHGRFSGDF